MGNTTSTPQEKSNSESKNKDLLSKNSDKYLNRIDNELQVIHNINKISFELFQTYKDKFLNPNFCDKLSLIYEEKLANLKLSTLKKIHKKINEETIKPDFETFLSYEPPETQKFIVNELKGELHDYFYKQNVSFDNELIDLKQPYILPSTTSFLQKQRGGQSIQNLQNLVSYNKNKNKRNFYNKNNQNLFENNVNVNEINANINKLQQNLPLQENNSNSNKNISKKKIDEIINKNMNMNMNSLKTNVNRNNANESNINANANRNNANANRNNANVNRNNTNANRNNANANRNNANEKNINANVNRNNANINRINANEKNMNANVNRNNANVNRNNANVNRNNANEKNMNANVNRNNANVNRINANEKNMNRNEYYNVKSLCLREKSDCKLTKKQICKVITSHYIIRNNIISAIMSVMPHKDQRGKLVGGFCFDRYNALNEGMICLPPDYLQLNRLPPKERIAKLMLFINQINEKNCQNIHGYYRKLSINEKKALSTKYHKFNDIYMKIVLKLKEDFLKNSNLLYELLNEMAQMTIINNNTLNMIAVKVKEVIDNMYNMCQKHYLNAVLALLKADLHVTEESIEEEEKLLTYLEKQL